MGPWSWFKDCWVMMQRTKPQYLSVLGRKRSSLRSPEKLIQEERSLMKSCVCVVVMLSSLCYGLLLLTITDAPILTAQTMLVPLVIAAIASISGGLCLSEYMSTHSQEVPSIYSCCYQHSSEILAFFTGWSWILSQAATTAAICKVSAILVNQWTNSALQKFLEPWLEHYADAVPSVGLALAFSILLLTGISGSVMWFVVFTPVIFVLILSSFAITRASNKEDFFINDGNWMDFQSLKQVFMASSVCLLFFSGPQSLLRITQRQVRRKTTAVLGPLNFICFILILGFLFMASTSGKFFDSKQSPYPSIVLADNILLCISLCLLGLESSFPLHYVFEDMATDGLLFRNFAKKWKPFCLSVASGGVQFVCVTGISLLAAFLPLQSLLMISVVFPLTVNSIVPFLVLIQRYKDNRAWQYEPMFQTTAKSLRDRNRSKSIESQYSNGVGFDHTEEVEMSTTCIAEESSEDESETDIDSMVQQYRDQAKIANMPLLEEHDPSKQLPEPTAVSSFRACLAISAMFLTTIFNSVALNIADMDDRFVFFAVALVCMLLSTIFQGMLLCLPQNGIPSGCCCPRIPRMPWIPGMASLINMCLLVHCWLVVWQVYLGWFILGLLIYFAYGIRSSTAANSFHNLHPTHIKLHPLPSYGNKCVPQVVPSQRKKLRTLSHIRKKTLA